MIQPADTNGLITYNFPPENPSNIFPPNFALNGFPNYQFTTNSSCISSNSTSDEAEGIIKERKQRRMISNRESARRSRLRKQRQLDELWSQVVRLRADNLNLIEKLNQLSESHDRVVQENCELKEQTSDLRKMLTDL
ncbi:hypothetical protein ACS0TY_008234 [Phlomoides rotata]